MREEGAVDSPYRDQISISDNYVLWDRDILSPIRGRLESPSETTTFPFAAVFPGTAGPVAHFNHGAHPWGSTIFTMRTLSTMGNDI